MRIIEYITVRRNADEEKMYKTYEQKRRSEQILCYICRKNIYQTSTEAFFNCFKSNSNNAVATNKFDAI